MVYARKCFDTDVAGMYAAAAIIGKLFIYGPAPISSVLFPLIVSNDERAYQINMLLKSIGMILIISMTGLIGLYLFSDTIVQILFGSKFVNITQYLIWIALAYIPYGLVLPIFNYFIARHDSQFSYIMTLVCICLFGYLMTASPSIPNLLLALGGAGVGLNILGLICLYWDQKQESPKFPSI
jgi:O-antigen/teichoic acid export membrane protein